VVRVASRLRREKYDVVLDLQRNWVSRLLRRGLAPAAWAEFDRFSSRPAGSRTLETFHSAGFRETELCFRLPVRIDLIESAARVLQQNGWNGSVPVVVLNPAGLWTTRNWPLENYIEFARLWIRHQDAMFLFLGTERIQREAGVLSSSLGRNAINLVGRTSLRDVLPLLQHVSFVLSEDSGLMHMAWTSGIPTLALFGSSRHDWSAPMGPHARCLHSGDLPCGACMSPTCAFGDVHCLTRHTADAVFRAAQSVMQPTRMFRS
jgi:ADP-heptose:LPS heptosyltransferase